MRQSAATSQKIPNFFCAKNKYDYISAFVKVRGFADVIMIFYWRKK